MKRWRWRDVVAVLSAAGAMTLSTSSSASAWKPPTHLFGTETVLLDAQDGEVTIPDVSGDPAKAVTVPAHSKIVRALQKYPEAYRAGVLGPDAYPDLVHGQTAIHPETPESISDEWLSYLWEEAWRPDPSLFASDLPYSEDDQLRSIAFATGFLGGHAAGDMWAHSLVNAPEFSGGVFPSLLDHMEQGRVAVKHTIIETYIDKHRPGYSATAPTTYAVDAPDNFVATTLIMSPFAREHGKHKVLGPIIDKYWELSEEWLELRFDQENQDCLFPDAAECIEKEHGDHTHMVCGDGCAGNPLDAPINVVEAAANAAWIPWLNAWAEDHEEAIVGWIALQDRIAREMFAGKKPDVAELHDAVSDWTTRHLPSLAGLPDFVGSGSLWASNMLEATYARFFSCSGTTWMGLRTDPVFGPFAETYCDVHDAVSATAEDLAADAADDLLDGLLTSALSLDKLDLPTFEAVDLDGNGDISPGEVLNLFAEPEDYFDDTRLFAPGDRALVDEHMSLTPGVDDDAGEVFRNYRPDGFAALRNTTLMGQLSLLEEDGLNQFIREKTTQAGGDGAAMEDLYHGYVNANTSLAPAWGVPNNVMLGWMRSLDGDHQWRTTSRFTADGTPPPAPPGGELWFTMEGGGPENGGMVGRITTTGHTSEYKLPGFPKMYGSPKDITPVGSGAYFTGVVQGRKGVAWVGIGQVSASGNMSIHVPPEEIRNFRPEGLAADANGNVWIADNARNSIWRLAGGGFTEYPLGAGTMPRNITPGSDGNMWFTEYSAGRIGRITPSGQITEFALPAGSTPFYITSGHDGALWFGGVEGGRIGRLTTDGDFSSFPAPNMQSIQGLTAGPDGAVWFVGAASNNIGRITTDGQLTTFAIPKKPGTVGVTPVEIATGPDGNLWFSQRSDSQMGRITPAGVITEYPVTEHSMPRAVAPIPRRTGSSGSSAPGVHGNGRMWLWEDCVSRRTAFRTTFREPVAGRVAFADAGDPATAFTDKTAPVPALSVADGRIIASGDDAVEPAAGVKLLWGDDEVPVSNPYSEPLASEAGTRTYRVRAVDGCGNVSAPVTREVSVLPQSGGGVTIPDGGEPPTVDPPKPEAKDVRRPRLSQLRASARRSGLVLRLRVDEPVTVTARVLRGRKLLARRSWRVKEPGAAVLRLQSRLPRRARLAIKLRAADVAGNAVTRSLGVRVR